MPRVLIIDDEPAIHSSLRFALEDRHHVETAGSAESGLAAVERDAPDLVLLDLRLGDADGLDVLRAIKERSPSTEVVMMTAFGSIRSSVECMRAGAFHYLTKPIDLEELRLTVSKALEFARLSRRVRDLTDQVARQHDVEGIVAESPAMRQVCELIHKVKDIDSNVLITGESGTGKELVARAIHFQGRRREHPFVVINCAAIPHELLESELFGYERGAFTGAVRPQKGQFELADGGTIFLDEIGEMDLALQAKILRVIQDKEVQPLGGGRRRPVNVRIVSATHRNLRRLVDEGRFREDLYFRLNVIPIELPPLRERREDIPPLARHLLERLRANLGGRVERISPAAGELLVRYSYPGNVRELQNILERAVVLCQGPAIEPEDLPPEVVRPGPATRDRTPAQPDIPVRLGEPLAEVERRVILRNLAAHHGNRRLTAQVLGINERTLRNKLREYRALARD